MMLGGRLCFATFLRRVGRSIPSPMTEEPCKIGYMPHRRRRQVTLCQGVTWRQGKFALLGLPLLVEIQTRLMRGTMQSKRWRLYLFRLSYRSRIRRSLGTWWALLGGN